MGELNKKTMIALMILVVVTVLSSAVYAALPDIFSSLNAPAEMLRGAAGDYKYIIVNTLILSALLIVGISFYPEGRLGKNQRNVLYVVAVAAAFFISFKLYPGEYLWDVRNIATVMHLKVLINIAVIAGFFFILINLPKIKDFVPKEGVAKWGIYLVIFIMAFMLAVSPLRGPDGKFDRYDEDEYRYIWERENLLTYRFILLGDSKCYAFDGYGFSEKRAGEVTLGDDTYSTNVFTASDGLQYYINKKGEFKRRDNRWHLTWFLRDDDMDATVKDTDSDIYQEYKRVEKYEDVKDGIADVTDTEAGDILSVAQALDKTARAGRYCYTQESIDDVIAGEANEYRDEFRVDAYSQDFKGFGILRGRHLFIFIFGTVLLVWLFGQLNVGGDIKWVKYIVALIVAGNMAHSGIGFRNFILLAEFITAFLLYRGMAGAEREKISWGNLIFAIFLTDFIYKTAFPSDFFRLPVVSDLGVGGRVAGVVFAFAGIKLTGIGGLAGVGVLAAMAGPKRIVGDVAITLQNAIARIAERLPLVKTVLKKNFNLREKNRRGEVHALFLQQQNYIVVLMNFMLRLEVFKSKMGAVRQRKRELHNVIKKIGKDFSMARFVKQLELFKMGPRLKIDEEMPDENLIKKDPGNKDAVEGDFEGYEEGELVSDYSYGSSSGTYYDATWGTMKSLDKGPYGSMALYRIVLKMVEDLMREYLNEKSLISWSAKETVELANQKEISIRKKLLDEKGFYGKILADRKKYESYFEKFWQIRIVRAVADELLDQYLMEGEYKHPYKFLKPNAEIKYYEYEITQKGNSKNFGFELAKDPLTAKEAESRVDKLIEKGYTQQTIEIETGEISELIERKYLGESYRKRAKEVVVEGKVRKKVDFIRVDISEHRKFVNLARTRGTTFVGGHKVPLYREVGIDGVLTEDRNNIINGLQSGMTEEEVKKRYPLIRKAGGMWIPTKEEYGKYSSLLSVGDFSFVINWLLEEWKGFIDDLSYGTYHPNSRTASDYKYAYDTEHDFTYKKVRQTQPSKGSPAFDFEALNDPGELHYWGRKMYNDGVDTINDPPKNPYPGLSTGGISSFVAEHFERKLKPASVVKQILNNYAGDVSETGRRFGHLGGLVKETKK